MTQASCLTGFLPARLDYVRRCPARSEYIELCFSTEAGTWNWCFPEPAELSEPRSPEPLALKAGRYGVQAHPVGGSNLDAALPSSAALPMILAGTEVHIASQLVAAMH